MALTPQQIANAATVQGTAAHDLNPAGVRTIAGPGTGKSHCIEERVHFLLRRAVSPANVFVISFTRATAKDIGRRILEYCTARGQGTLASLVHVSTMHSLALSALRRANLLTMFPVHPMVMDDWEQTNVFDAEFADNFHTTTGRAKQIRLAYDAYWQTLQQVWLTPVSAQERANFEAFYSQSTILYSCILPGEVVRRCVENINVGNLDPTTLLGIEHLIVDEFQDLNACDQEFIQSIASGGATLWVAGDDDQSIYAFRHAAPSGIQTFHVTYPGSTSHTLTDCFRCTPAILSRATALIALNPSPPRLPKNILSMYSASVPPVTGRLDIWCLPNGGLEATALAESCAALIAAGVPAAEILILIANRPAQLSLIEESLDAAAVPYTAPKGPQLAETPMGRSLLATLRIVSNRDDYAAHRDFLGLHDGVGMGTCLSIGSSATAANLNFRDIFYVPVPSSAFTPRASKAIARAAQVCHQLQTWDLADDLASHDAEIAAIFAHVFNPARARYQEVMQEWQTLRSILPGGITLDELLAYVWSDSEVEQLRILQAAQQRLGLPPVAGQGVADRVRILTMHGAKGLEGKVVFIPGLEMEIIPGRRALASPGLIQEARRLLYVSVARAKACCILTRVGSRTGQQAKALSGAWQFGPAPSLFIGELGIVPQPRQTGLQPQEVQAIAQDCVNL